MLWSLEFKVKVVRCAKTNCASAIFFKKKLYAWLFLFHLNLKA